MKRSLSVIVFVIALSTGLMAASATISGKVSGVSGVSVVYVDAVAGKTFPAPAKSIVVDQKGLLFQPHVVVVQQGATVEFLNSDTVQHNVFWPAVGSNKKASHNMGTWPRGEKRAFKFDTPGVVPLLCNVHPEMSGYIVVAPTPYFAQTDAQGNYTIENVPDGNYNVVAWHEGAKQQTKPATVAGPAKVDFTLSK